MRNFRCTLGFGMFMTTHSRKNPRIGFHAESPNPRTTYIPLACASSLYAIYRSSRKCLLYVLSRSRDIVTINISSVKRD